MPSVLTMTAIQKEIAPNMLSRTMATVQLANMGLLPVGYILAGPVMSLLGAADSLAMSGVCVLCSVAILCDNPELPDKSIKPACYDKRFLVLLSKKNTFLFLNRHMIRLSSAARTKRLRRTDRRIPRRLVLHFRVQFRPDQHDHG